MKLTPENVNLVFMDCLFLDGEPTEPRVIGKGVLHDFGFQPERLAAHEEQVIEMLDQLPKEFHEDGGQGWSFLNACGTRDGDLWTGDHAAVQQLVALGGAIGRVKFLFPRDAWPHLPGGVPYFVILKKKAAPCGAAL
jgi:hypothetical protein